MWSQPISIVVTTFATDSYYTQACLESIRRWKRWHHELIVVVHDESPLLGAYLEACAADGLIDQLVFASSGHGHIRGFNLGARRATADVVFNVCNDILVGPSLIDDCAFQLRSDRQLGIIGWHWHNEGTLWRDGRIVDFALRDAEQPDLPRQHIDAIEKAPWFTGRYFAGIGGPRWVHLCNGSFFGIRRELLDRIGGGFGPQYSHYWADDFLCYAVLDQGLDVRHFDSRFRGKPYFAEFQYDNTDVADRRRHADCLCCDEAFLESIQLVYAGMSPAESVFLHHLGRSIPDGATIVNAGVWHGSSAIVLLDAVKDRRATFHFIDCFDLPGISQMSAQPPVSRSQFEANIAPYVQPQHRVCVTQANTLELQRFPTADFVFVDAGHTEECIVHDARLAEECLSPRGVAAFHDYGCGIWPAVKPALEARFSNLQVFETLAVFRREQKVREEYVWPDAASPRNSIARSDPPVALVN